MLDLHTQPVFVDACQGKINESLFAKYLHTVINLKKHVRTRLGCFYVTAILSWGYGWGWVEAEVDLNLRLKWGWDEI